MIIGTVAVNPEAVVTHRDTYFLSNLSVVSVRRPFLGGAVVLCVAFGAFGLAFANLLYSAELIAIVVILVLAIIAGTQIGVLKLLSRDLKGTELSEAIWGQHMSLQAVRQDIVIALHAFNNGDAK